MKLVNSLFFVFLINFIFSQTSSKSLKKEQQKLESRILKTKSLLEKVKTNSQASLNELRLINNQINSREELIRVYDNQLKAADLQSTEKKQTIDLLEKRLVNLKKQYRDMLIYAYKHRSKFSGLMYILSASDYNEAIKRNNYLKIVGELQKKQVAMILQNQKLINGEIKNIDEVKNEKMTCISQKKNETNLIELDKINKEITFNKYKQEEDKLFVQLNTEERKKQELKQLISQAIKKEISIEQKKQAEKTTKPSKTKKNTTIADKTNESVKESKDKETPKKILSPTYIESKENSTDDKKFFQNKGLLSSPVKNGSITERYGRNSHPTLSGVVTNNNGIDITCSVGSIVSSIFEGEVTSIFSIAGAGKVIIIKHGSYRSVYSNIQESYVSVGAKVSVRQNIGSLIKEGGISICHFEIHQVINGVTQSLNPSLWISK